MSQGATGNPTVQGKLRQREKEADHRWEEDLRWVMSTHQGRRVMYSLIFERADLLNIYSGLDNEGLQRHEGIRWFGNMLVGELQKRVPEEYLLMVSEHMRADDTETKVREKINSETDEEKDG